MTKRTTKRALFLSALSLLLCVSMLIGTTYAWFTDQVFSGNNVIVSGNLNVEMYHSNAAVADEKVDSTVTLFNDLQGNPILWEPGVVTYENLRIVNEGDLALTYNLSITAENENFVLDPSGEQYGLSQALKVGIVDGGITATDREGVIESVSAVDWTSLEDFLCSGSLLPEKEGSFEENWGVVIYWEPGANDNLFNLNNGKTLSDGEVLSIDLGVKLVATQEQFESDAFGADYDADAVFPVFYGRFRASASVEGKVDADNKLTENVLIGNENGRMSAVVPKGTVVTPGTTKLVMVVNTTERNGTIEMTRGQVSRSLDVHVDGIAAENTTPIAVDLGAVMPKGMKDSSIQIFHVENDTPVRMTAVDVLTAHNQFTYDAESGEMTVNMASFSEVTAVVAAGDPWNGTFDTSWYNTTDTVFTLDTAEEFAGFGAIVGGMADGIERDTFAGKTVKLGANLDLGGLQSKAWYPIGYYNSTESYTKVSGGTVTSDVYSFEGIFDGQKHTISNIYQNTWDMFGDYNTDYQGTPNHYKDGMGIFGFVLNGTVKNLTVNNFQSDGEFCTTGVVAAYAAGSSTFENINITKSNPRAYNVPNGGVVGYAYAEDGQTNTINFNNVTVDSSNKISALWGSWDVGCGGILGRVNGATTVNMTGCEVGAEIDVFNDVCGNYQYYQYRYSGMLIGTVGGDSDPKTGAEKVNFSDVTVHLGDWADYYYCEFEENSQGSYTDDFQFSRVDRGDIVFNEYNMPTSCKHTHTANEDKLALFLPFNQLYTGYGWGSSPVATADGVTVNDHFYSITYLDADGSFIDIEYVTVGQNDDTHNMANAHEIKKTNSVAGKTFDGWVDSYSNKIDTIDAGNRKNIVLYASYANQYTARWIDEDGNVIHTQTVNSSMKVNQLDDVAGPESSNSGTVALTFDHWEVKDSNGKFVAVKDCTDKISDDITIQPSYAIAADANGNGKIKLVAGPDADGDNKPDYYTVEAASGLSGKVTIPGEVNGVPVTVITDLSSDSVNWDVNSITIQNGVREIGSEAFAMTAGLSEVNVPASVTKIGSNAFSSGWGSLTAKKVTITYDGTWEQWQAACNTETSKDTNWDSGLGNGSKVVCTDGTYVLSTGWLDGNHTWNDWKKQ